MALVAPLLRLRGIGKAYGGVRALEDIDLDVAAGEVVAVCGDNGAGKSTLIRIVSGAETPREGTIELHGHKVRFRAPSEALAAGIATIYQDLALAPRLSIAQNIFMGHELTRFGLLDWPSMRRQAARHLERFRFEVPDMDRPVSALSGGQRQAVALARALRGRARLVIMDEPTAALGVAESAQVLALVGTLRCEGVAILLVSHDMDDVRHVADRVVLLKRGRKTAEFAAAGFSADHLAHAVMTGRAPSNTPLEAGPRA